MVYVQYVYIPTMYIGTITFPNSVRVDDLESPSQYEHRGFKEIFVRSLNHQVRTEFSVYNLKLASNALLDYKEFYFYIK